MAIYLKYLLKAPRSNITRYYALYEQLMDEDGAGPRHVSRVWVACRSWSCCHWPLEYED